MLVAAVSLDLGDWLFLCPEVRNPKEGRASTDAGNRITSTDFRKETATT